MKITADKAKAFAILAAVAVAGFVAWKVYSAGGAVADTVKELITQDLNPLSTENAVYRMFEERDASGNVESTLGTRIYDSTHHSDGSFAWPWEEKRRITDG